MSRIAYFSPRTFGMFCDFSLKPYISSFTSYNIGGRSFARAKCVCDFDLLTLLGVFFADKGVTGFCLFANGWGVANPSLFNLEMDFDLVSR